MIITCNNCNKKFDTDSNLIPDKGRLLQCASCDHKWFFKKEVLENTVSPIAEDIDNDNVNIFVQNNLTKNDEISPSNLLNEELDVDTEEKLDEKIELNNEDEPKNKIDANINESTKINAKPKNFKILNIFIVAIISLVAFIIIVDTFKYPIGKIVPNTEFILYNLYESIKDIILFIRDLT